MKTHNVISISDNGEVGHLAQRAELSCYPTALMDEYRALVKKELNGSIMPDEIIRFQRVRDQINEIDSKRSRPDIWDIQRTKLREELAQLRAEVEALADA